MSHILVAVAWPYANGSLHLGHLAGAYLPADIFARYHRLVGNDVLMVSGSDAHGTPITVRAETESTTPEAIVDRFHPEFLGYWRDLGISFDLFTVTNNQNHADVTQDVFLRLLEQGFLVKKTSDQFYDPAAERFLPDRYVEGTCPHCGYEHARGDQCDNCGRTLDPTDLVDPRSKFTGVTPEIRATEHFYLTLSTLEPAIKEYLDSRVGWRNHVLNWAKGFVGEGLHDRAITRDMEWGVPVPVDDLGPGKRIYVWFDAVIGYLSAAKEWASIQGTPDAWKAWWEDPEARSYYFVGKDNIPFHAVIWPAMLIGYGGLNLPTDVPANQYVTFKGQQASKSRGVGASINDYLEWLEPDALRYAMAANLPEQSDTDLTDEDLVRRINEELVANWGNLVNRVTSLIARNFDATIPSPGRFEPLDEETLAGARDSLDAVSQQIENVNLRAGLRAAMESAASVNAYLSHTEPWKVVKEDRDRAATILFVAINAVASINVALAPYLPHTSERVAVDLGLGEVSWKAPDIVPGTVLAKPNPLFQKAELPE
ncbi:MAG: methionine--tRNA ligase [Acidimicrobiia bacterium]|nr:methionine--tRNA ligase [Acidimicrobiia bacterium]NND14485.1 methionine--tRNA ligase [Acidimicrobiia bacterium]NNL27197.1 methionine--tRNA ligase [Acidimicrobiia bacterium]